MELAAQYHADVHWVQHDIDAVCVIARCHGWASYKSILLQLHGTNIRFVPGRSMQGS
jgi:hypothetical protein